MSEIDKQSGPPKTTGLFKKLNLDEQGRMMLYLFVLWAMIGWLDLQELALNRDYPISLLYILVIIPAAVVFGKVGILVTVPAVLVMYHFTNDKTGLSSYNEAEYLRLAFVLLLSFAFDRIAADRKQIKYALSKLQRETKVREDLTHMLVHDLRTPLTGILTSLQTLQLWGNMDDDQTEMIDFAVANSQRLLEMVNQILDVAKLEAGELSLRLQEVPIAEVAENACLITQPIALENGIELSHECDGIKANLDPDLIRRVLVNLIGNALKFTPRDGKVTVLAANGTSNGEAHLVVKDTGHGIPEDDLGRIFEKFAQSKGSDKGGASTGIGLTFCRLAVEAHGGRIWAESEVGRGTEIHIKLPLDPKTSAQLSLKRN